MSDYYAAIYKGKDGKTHKTKWIMDEMFWETKHIQDLFDSFCTFEATIYKKRYSIIGEKITFDSPEECSLFLKANPDKRAMTYFRHGEGVTLTLTGEELDTYEDSPYYLVSRTHLVSHPTEEQWTVVKQDPGYEDDLYAIPTITDEDYERIEVYDNEKEGERMRAMAEAEDDLAKLDRLFKERMDLDAKRKELCESIWSICEDLHNKGVTPKGYRIRSKPRNLKVDKEEFLKNNEIMFMAWLITNGNMISKDIIFQYCKEHGLEDYCSTDGTLYYAERD